jgi:hypothetical protein
MITTGLDVAELLDTVKKKLDINGLHMFTMSPHYLFELMIILARIS